MPLYFVNKFDYYKNHEINFWTTIYKHESFVLKIFYAYGYGSFISFSQWFSIVILKMCNLK